MPDYKSQVPAVTPKKNNGIENNTEESYRQGEGRGLNSGERRSFKFKEVHMRWRPLRSARDLVRLTGEQSFEQTIDTVTLNEVQHNNELRKKFENTIGQPLPNEAKHLDENQAKKQIFFLSPLTNSAASTPVTAETFAGEDFSLSARQSLQDVMKGSLQQMALDILLETGLKLTGIDKSVTETFVPVIKLIREARTALLSGDGKLADRIKGLTEALNTARSSLEHIGSDSVIFRGTDILCDVADVLHKGLTSSDLSTLKAPMEKLADMPELTFVQGVIPLLELGGQLQQWNNNSITGQDLVRFLVEKVVPEELALPLKVGEKIALGVQFGNLHMEGLPAWPGSTDKVACLQWIRMAMTNERLRETIATTDIQYLTDTLAFNTEEAEYARTTFLQYAQSLASFPAQGTPGDWLMALKMMPGLSEIASRADLSLNDNLGTIGSLLQDNTTLSRLEKVVTVSGTREKAWEALKLLDKEKSLVALKNLSIEVLKKTFQVSSDATSAIWLVLKKGHTFLQSAYSVGQSFSDPVRLYRDVISFIKEDVKNYPDDYKNATVETLLATVAMVFKSLGGNHVPINWGGNTAEWLKAYSGADQEKLTAVDHVLMHAVLEPRVVLEIKRAIQLEDTVQARKLLEPLRDALRSYAGYLPVLRQMVDALPYIPAMSEVWKEIRAMDLREREELYSELSQQTVLHNDILHNSRKHVSPETQASRHQSVLTLQKKLIVLLNKCGVGSGQVNMLQADLNAMQVALKTLPNEAQTRLTEELNSAQTGVDNLKKPDVLKALSVKEMAQIYSRQTAHLQDVRQTLTDEGVTPATILQAQLNEMKKALDTLSVDVKLTDMGSLVHFAAEALTRLATSTKPSLVSARGELATLVRNSASDGLADVVRWSGNQMMKLFTKEVALTSVEKDIGLFVIERDLSAGQLVKGVTAGTTFGALLSAVFLLPSGEGISVLKESKEQPVKETVSRTAPGGGEPGMINVGSSQETVRQSPPHAEVYSTPTEALPPESHGLNTWLMLALPVVAGALAGAGIATTMKPAIREKYAAEGMSAINDPTRTPKPGERLYTHTDTEGVTKGIYLTDAMVDTARIIPALATGLSEERSRQRRFVGLWGSTRAELRRKQKQDADKQQRTNPLPTSWQSGISSKKVEINLYEISKRTGGWEDPLYNTPTANEAINVNPEKYELSLDETPDEIVTKYLKSIYRGYGNGLSYDDDVLDHDITVKYEIGGITKIVTPKQMVTNQVDSLLQTCNNDFYQKAALFNPSKIYSFPSRYPLILQEKLKAGDFWDTIKKEFKTTFTDPEKVKVQKEEIRLRCLLAITMYNGDKDISSVLSRTKPVLYKSRIVTGMFMVTDRHTPRQKGKIYSLYNSFKPVEIEYETDVAWLLHGNKDLAAAIERGFTSSGSERKNLLTTDNKLTNMNPNKVAQFYAWEGASSEALEDLMFTHMRDRLYLELDRISISNWENMTLKALEIVKFGANILSLIPVTHISSALGAVAAAAALIQSRTSENDEISKEYAKEGFWGVALSVLDFGSLGSGKTLRELGPEKIKGIAHGLDDHLYSLKNGEYGVIESLSNFKCYVSNVKKGNINFNEFTNQSGVSYKKAKVVAEGTAGKIFDIGDGFLVKEYKRPLKNSPQEQLKSSLAEANNNLRAFNRIYGKGAAVLNISPGADEFTKIVTIKMKKIPGDTLRNLARSNSSDKDVAMGLLCSEDKISNVVESVLAKLKSKGVIHDDINETNILFDADSKSFKLIDFDRARVSEDGPGDLIIPLADNKGGLMRTKLTADLRQFVRDVSTPGSAANVERIFGHESSWSYNLGIAVLRAHGAFGGGNINHMTGFKAAEEIKKILGVQKIYRLELFSCFGGMWGGASSAQVIANELNVPVKAYKWTISNAISRQHPNRYVMRYPRIDSAANDKKWNEVLHSISERILHVRRFMREPDIFALGNDENNIHIHNLIKNITLNQPDDEWISKSLNKVISNSVLGKIIDDIDLFRSFVLHLSKNTVYIVTANNKLSYNDIVESYKEQFNEGEEVNEKFAKANPQFSQLDKYKLLCEGDKVLIPQ